MASCCSIVAVTAVLALLAACAVVYYNKPEIELDPQPYQLQSQPNLEGPIAPNNHLRNAQILLKGTIQGPESLLVEDGTIYTGTLDGKLLKIRNNVVEKTIKLVPGQEECGTYDGEPKCGRPLGIRRLNGQELVVVDAYFGIFTVDFDKGISKKVFDSTKELSDGSRLMFLNDLDVLDTDNIFFTDSSSRFDRRRFLHIFLEQKPTGRVFKLNISSGRLDPVLSGLYFANGIQILPDRQSFVVSECSMARILRHYFDGPKKGQTEVFLDNLPGFPDNIRASFSGDTFYVGLAGIRNNGTFSLVDHLGDYPLVRKITTQIIPERYMARLFTLVKVKYGFVIEFDASGKILRSYQDPTGKVVSDVSQVSDDRNHLYLGSFHSDFIVKVPKKAL